MPAQHERPQAHSTLSACWLAQHQQPGPPGPAPSKQAALFGRNDATDDIVITRDSRSPQVAGERLLP
jgi:hypothetical protein